jgi:hypothetical protein
LKSDSAEREDSCASPKPGKLHAAFLESLRAKPPYRRPHLILTALIFVTLPWAGALEFIPALIFIFLVFLLIHGLVLAMAARTARRLLSQGVLRELIEQGTPLGRIVSDLRLYHAPVGAMALACWTLGFTAFVLTGHFMVHYRQAPALTTLSTAATLFATPLVWRVGPHTLLLAADGGICLALDRRVVWLFLKGLLWGVVLFAMTIGAPLAALGWLLMATGSQSVWINLTLALGLWGIWAAGVWVVLAGAGPLPVRPWGALRKEFEARSLEIIAKSGPQR